MADFLMPSLGADMEDGVITEWKVAVGDTVKRGQIVAVVETSKADIDVEVFEDGVVDELLALEGERVAVGTPIARIADGSGASAPAAPSIEAVQPVTVAPPPAVPPARAAVPAPPRDDRAHEHVRISPVARRAADALHVDFDTIEGTGPGGAICKRDIERVAAGTAPAPPPPAAPPSVPASPAPGPATNGDRSAAMREAIGALMARSKREIPHYYLTHEIDMTAALAWMRARNAERIVSERLVSGALLMRAAALALREVPELNGFWEDGGFRAGEHVHLGVAVSLRGGGLVAPAIHDADTCDVDELMARLRDLVRRARGGHMRQSEMSDPTITVTSLGDQGVDSVTGVIYPPQVALIGFGRVRERPWAHDGMIGSRESVIATLAADHRASDGHTGARLLRKIDTFLQKPEEL